MCGTRLRNDRPCVVVIGCDDVGSAIATTLHRAGIAVAVVDRADPPWSRRGRSYTDAWYVGGATLDDIDACFCTSVKSIPALLDRGDMIAATTWSWEGVAASLGAAAVVETRIERAVPAQHSRPSSLERVLTIGVRAARIAGWPVDVFIGHPGADLARASVPDRGSLRGARDGVEQIDAPHGGRFHTRHQVAERVERGDIVGELGTFAVVAPVAGTLTALAARGARIEPSHMLAEIDPGSDAASCFGIVPETRTVAHRVAAALRNARDASSRSNPARAPHSVPA